jgi:hypothetical protein
MSISASQNPRHSPRSTYVLVYYLTWLSIFPLIKMCLKGSLCVHYHNASSGGLQLISLLRLLGLVTQEPVRIKDLKKTDFPHSQIWNLHHLVFRSCSAQSKRIERIIKTCLPFLDSSERKFYAVSVKKALAAWLIPVLLFRQRGRDLAYEKNLPLEQVVLISPFAPLIDFLELDPNSAEEIAVISQPFRNKALFYSFGASWLSIWRLVRKCVHLFLKPLTFLAPLNKESRNVGIEAAWHLSSPDQPNEFVLDDLFWWKESTIPPERIRYFYDREHPYPTVERLKKTSSQGIQSILLDLRFCGDAPELLLKTPAPHKTVRSLFYDLWFSGKLLCRAIFSDEMIRTVVSIIHWHYIKSKGLADIYKSLGIRALFYTNEGGFDVFSLAAKSADAIRIGVQFTCLLGIEGSVTPRSHDVFFFWGQHDIQVALDSGCVSKHMLVSGCFLTGRSNPQARDDAQSLSSGLRKLGVDYVLAVFDTSAPTPNFFRFLLEWLIEDPKLGLLIKSKQCTTWADVIQLQGNTSLDDSFGELLQSALDTQRIHLMSPYASPGDAALVSDFTLGVGTASSSAVAALQGGKVIFIDYERLDQGPQNPYAIFHSLGPNRCVFYDLETLKQEILKYASNPKSNPHLGDASPILHLLDSFCDSGASRRIAEYVEWYMEGLDRGFGRDEATLSATRKYAEKWGKDKVVRGL